MIYAYIRVSTSKQSPESQKTQILNYCEDKNIEVNKWITETVSGKKDYRKRKLGDLINVLSNEDSLIVTELSRLGRNFLEVMHLLKLFIDKKIKLISLNENYVFDDSLQSNILAFAFTISAQVERQFIRDRTKAGLDKAVAEGKVLGKPKGYRSNNTRLSGKENDIKEMLKKGVSIASISKMYDVSWSCAKYFITSRNLKDSTKKKEPTTKRIKLDLWLRVERNNKFVRGMKKSRKEIEDYLSCYYNMKKKTKDGWDYELIIEYTTENELDDIVYDIYREMEFRADCNNCWTEADIRIPDGEKSW